eukprot:scaffold88402_cov28-Tisochrysis_lutea.AAC.2
MAAPSKPLLLASWNVAGWEATLKYIRSHYGSIGSFFDRHGFDILCVQEVKATLSRMEGGRAAAMGALSLDGWDSFWALSQRGFNGCTTFARKGLTSRADASPLGDAALDAEGRQAAAACEWGASAAVAAVLGGREGSTKHPWRTREERSIPI